MSRVLVDLLTPLLRDGFRRVLILNGHGGNIDPLRVALRRLDVEFPRAILTGAAYWDLAADRAGRALPGRLARRWGTPARSRRRWSSTSALTSSGSTGSRTIPTSTPKGNLRGPLLAEGFRPDGPRYGVVGYPEGLPTPIAAG